MKFRFNALVALAALCLAGSKDARGADSLRVQIQGGVPPIVTSLTQTTTTSSLQVNSTVYPATTNQGVTWSVISGSTATGSVSTTGLVTVNAQTSGYIWIKAVSTADVTKSDSVKILVYCRPSHTNPINWFLIDTVRILGTTLYNGSSNTGSAAAYTQFPASGSSTATLTKGDSYRINTQVTSTGLTQPDTTMNTYSLSGWIDYNANGVFEQNEWLDIEDSALNRYATHTFTVPTTAATGYVMMRVRSRVQGGSNGVGDMCLSFPGSGQTEDYLIQLQDVPTCNGDPGKNPGDMGCVKFTYNGKTVVYPTVRGKDGNVWIQKNLGANYVATSLTDADGYGDVFQWGRWDDGHQLRNAATSATAPSPNNPAGLGNGTNLFYTTSPAWWNTRALTDTWDASTPAGANDSTGCDPCKQLGADWHLPSVADWQSVISAESITTPALGASSNLKLPATGVRNSSGGYDFVGTRGYYWSNEPSSTGGKYVYISSFIVNPTAGGLRAQGAAVRCLKSFRVDSVKVSVNNNAQPLIITDKGTLNMAVKVYPTTVRQDVTWTIVPGTGRATVNAAGRVTAVGNGTVWAKAVSVLDTTKADSVMINITGQVIPVDSVKVNTQANVPAQVTTLGGTLQMESQVYPLNAIQTVTWRVVPTTGNATVNATGLLTAVGNGNVWVKAISTQDTTKADSMQITISGQPIPVDSVRIKTRNGVPPVITTPNGTLQLDGVVYPTGTSQAVSWSMRSIFGTATIDANGLLTAQNDAIILVKATSTQDSRHGDSIIVNITGQTTGIDLIKVDYGITAYPNPARDYIYLTGNNAHPALGVALYDIAGRKYNEWKLVENALIQPVQLNVKNIVPGVYVLKVTGDKLQKTILIKIEE